MTDEEVMLELRSDSSLNKARREFSSARSCIEQAGQQRKGLNPVDMRRMEFEAVRKIIDAYKAQ
jgi:hypothetical protein